MNQSLLIATIVANLAILFLTIYRLEQLKKFTNRLGDMVNLALNQVIQVDSKTSEKLGIKKTELTRDIEQLIKNNPF